MRMLMRGFMRLSAWLTPRVLQRRGRTGRSNRRGGKRKRKNRRKRGSSDAYWSSNSNNSKRRRSSRGSICSSRNS
jgi:hypothetical protein